MKLRTRKASWFVSGLLLLAAVSAGLGVVVAQPKSETSRPVFDASEAAFESLGENKFVNINNIAFTSDDDRLFDIYFTCSSSRGEDPLRLTDAKDIIKARSYFNDEKRYVKHFVKLNKYCISARNIAYIESKDDSVIRLCSMLGSLGFIRAGEVICADAESFTKKMREF